MVEHRACLECLRRSWLLAALGPYVERIATGEVGSRSPELLRLSNEELVEVAAPKVAGQTLARVAALSETRLNEELAQAEPPQRLETRGCRVRVNRDPVRVKGKAHGVDVLAVGQLLAGARPASSEDVDRQAVRVHQFAR